MVWWVTAIYYVVVLALSIALSPKPRSPKSASIDDFEFPTAEEGRPIPVAFGEVDITGPNVLWYGDLQVNAIKQRAGFSKATVGYKYFIGFHLGLCHGPVDAVTRIGWGGKEAWTGNITANGSGNINNTDIFGGNKRGGGLAGDFDIMMGGPAQTSNGYLDGAIGETTPAFRGILSLIWRGGWVGNSENVRPLAVRVKRILQGWEGAVWNSADADCGNGMNPAHMVYQVLTDTRWGMGIPTDKIGLTSFGAAADTFLAENLGLNMLWNQTSSIEDFLQVILNHVGGGITQRMDTGLYEFTLFRGGYDPVTLPVYDQSNILDLKSFQKQGWGSTVNEVQVLYTDPNTRLPTSITAQDLGNIDSQGARIPAVVDLKGIRDHAVAEAALARELASRTTPLTKISFEVNREAWAIAFGGLFRLTWPARQCNLRVFRVLKVDRGTLQRNSISIEALEDIYQYPLGTGIISQAPVVGPTPPATPADDGGTTAAVISATTTAPPVSPAADDQYFVPTGSTGAWAGHDGELAIWDAEAAAWVFEDIPDGSLVYVEDTTATIQVINGSAVDFQAGTPSAAAAVTYDDSDTLLGANNVQDAIELLAESVAQTDRVTPAAFANGLWYGTNSDQRLFDTTDGTTWTPRSSAGDTTLTSLVYAGSRFHGIRGNELGRSNTADIYGAWTYQAIGTAEWQGLKQLPSGDLVAWTGSAVRISADNGATWTDPAAGAPDYATTVAADTPEAWFRVGDGVSSTSDEQTTYYLRLAGGTGETPVAGLAGGGVASSYTPRVDLEARALPAPGGPTNVVQGLGDFSVELWMKRGIGAAPVVEITLFAQARGLTPSGYYDCVSLTYRPSDQRLRFLTRTATGPSGTIGALDQDISDTAVGDLFDGNRHHLVATRGTGGRASIWLDGVEVANRASGTISDLTPTVGQEYGTFWGNTFSSNTPAFTAVYDELAIYLSELSAARVGAHYSAGIAYLEDFAIADVIEDAAVSPTVYRLIGDRTRYNSSTSFPTGAVPEVYETDDWETYALVATLSSGLSTNVETRDCPVQDVTVESTNSPAKLAVAFRHISAGYEQAFRIAYTEDNGATWTLMPEEVWPDDGLGTYSLSVNGDKSLVWDGVQFLVSGRGWSGVSPNLDDSPLWTFSGIGSGIPASARMRHFPNLVGSPLPEHISAIVLSGGFGGTIVSADGLNWARTQGTPAKPLIARGATWVGTAAISTPVNDVAIYIQRNCIIRSVSVIGDPVNGSCQIDIRRAALASYPPTSGDSIVAGYEPGITSARTLFDDALVGWDTTLFSGDAVTFVLQSCANFKQVHIALHLEET